jgi:predicted DCC family thiol-disulfide oxidoreductase YuxK
MKAAVMDATANPAKPLLIYDGDCDFCYYWVCYWQKLTGDAVTYKPYQEVAAQFPSIPISEFKRAIQYVAPDGTISSSAKASFLTLSHAPEHDFGLTCYRKVPGFAAVAEKAYTFISQRRSFFYKISKVLWGKPLEPQTFDSVSWIFLRLLGLIFFAAFFSFGTQALALIGSQGIVSVSNFMDMVSSQVGAIKYWFIPMVFWLDGSDTFIQGVCWGGAALSLLFTCNIFPRISLFCMYILYLSLCYAGQIFMTFQWDLFLLETSVVAFYLIGTTRQTGILLTRWLLFRFIFAGGLVKIYSYDPTWRSLTALSYYFNTAPLPTPLAWYAHHLPAAFLKVSTFSALFIEIVMPFLIFFPRKLRFIAGFAILFMQTLITLTGNYNFFNLLTMSLCLTLFDDQAMRWLLPKRFMAWLQPRVVSKPPTRRVAVFANTVAIFLIFVSVAQFHERFSGPLTLSISIVTHSIDPLRIVNGYGPFAVMTTERMEIIFEGSADGIYWAEYGFKYKPGDVNRRPPWNIPHQPRVDWQMWFAALGTINQNPWMLSFIHGLLLNSPAIVGLLEYNPFPDKPPLYVRGLFYRYRFTTPEEKAKTGAWWEREYVQDYFPPVHLTY